jgi:hypothetical protein
MVAAIRWNAIACVLEMRNIGEIAYEFEGEAGSIS